MAFIGMMLASCEDGSKSPNQSPSVDVTTVKFKSHNHDYLIIHTETSCCTVRGIVHDPDCAKCKQDDQHMNYNEGYRSLPSDPGGVNY